MKNTKFNFVLYYLRNSTRYNPVINGVLDCKNKIKI